MINKGTIFKVMGKVNGNQPGMVKCLNLTVLSFSDLLPVPPIDHTYLKALGSSLMQVDLWGTEQGV